MDLSLFIENKCLALSFVSLHFIDGEKHLNYKTCRKQPRGIYCSVNIKKTLTNFHSDD